MKTPKEGMNDVINWLLWLLDVKLPPPPPPPVPVDTDWHVSPSHEIKRFFDANELDNIGYRDGWYWGVDIETWMEWCYEALDGCPPYTLDSETGRGFNCDAFAEEFAAYCKRTYQANKVWAVWGDTPQGYHAWSLVQGFDDWYEIEPQNGEFWVYDTNPRYKARKRV